jgi:DNA-binding GntR family transcriptional regulator
VIETRSLVDQIYDHLRTRLITGAMAYGEVLSIKQIAAELSVSTMPVREAVKRLEFEQVVNILPRRCCRIRTPSRKMIGEVYELRIVLEQFAVSKSAGKARPESLARLGAIVERMRALQREPDTPLRATQAVVLDRDFHAEICALAENDFLNAYYRQLNMQVNMSLIHAKTYQRLKDGWAEAHAEILRCLERGPADAVAALQRHFRNVTELLEAEGSAEEGAAES